MSRGGGGGRRGGREYSDDDYGGGKRGGGGGERSPDAPMRQPGGGPASTVNDRRSRRRDAQGAARAWLAFRGRHSGVPRPVLPPVPVVGGADLLPRERVERSDRSLAYALVLERATLRLPDALVRDRGEMRLRFQCSWYTKDPSGGPGAFFGQTWASEGVRVRRGRSDEVETEGSEVCACARQQSVGLRVSCVSSMSCCLCLNDRIAMRPLQVVYFHTPCRDRAVVCVVELVVVLLSEDRGVMSANGVAWAALDVFGGALPDIADAAADPPRTASACFAGSPRAVLVVDSWAALNKSAASLSYRLGTHEAFHEDARGLIAEFEFIGALDVVPVSRARRQALTVHLPRGCPAGPPRRRAQGPRARVHGPQEHPRPGHPAAPAPRAAVQAEAG